ncbi:Peptidylprolyl isomerase [Caligus rogercresseyi]|uniref:Peptidylprolyl isomerase n=1 Tax=Caligus rogercresseyi TaxID=217165 RepID=A0A7T8HET5_CALRO|nr:Peptidylprolyl isomerase [Caligus rogercresseyi]
MEDILSPELRILAATVETLDITDVEDWSPLEGVEGIEKRVLDAGVELSGIGENDIALCHYSFTIEGDLEPFDSSLLRCKRKGSNWAAFSLGWNWL